MQGENIYIIIGGMLFCIALIGWVRYNDIKEIKKLKEENLEMDSASKMYKWRLYLVAAIGLLFFFMEIFKRFNIGLFD